MFQSWAESCLIFMTASVLQVLPLFQLSSRHLIPSSQACASLKLSPSISKTFHPEPRVLSHEPCAANVVACAGKCIPTK